jgi:putative membrane protein
MTDKRWPRWVYGTGDEPDYRFSFANERTFLAWVRTALALIAGGVAVDALDLLEPTYVRVALAGVLLALGLLCAASSWVRWARSERATRRGEPLPSSAFTAVLAGSIIVVVGVVLLGACET